MSYPSPPTIPERDWKLLRELKPELLDRICRRALADIAPLTAPGPGEALASYLELFEPLHKHDNRLAAAFNGLRRSRAKEQLALMRAFDLLTDEELGRFSDETRGFVERYRAMAASLAKHNLRPTPSRTGEGTPNSGSIPSQERETETPAKRRFIDGLTPNGSA